MLESWHKLALLLVTTLGGAGCGSDPGEKSDGAKSDGSSLEAMEDAAASTEPPQDAAGPNECLLQCPDPSRPCSSDPWSSISLAGTLQEWREGTCPVSGFPTGVMGVCADGKKLTYYSGGTSLFMRFFDADGMFIGMEYRSEGEKPGICGPRYWPNKIDCQMPKVTEVVCGSRLSVNDRIPW